MPPSLDDPERIREGLHHYHEMCVFCHGAPGVDRSEVGQGLNPKPPKLASGRRLTDDGAREAFWVVKNGIRMTGMPAFGPTHSDEKLWDVVAFLRRMQTMSPADYQAMVRSEGMEVSHGEEGEEGEHGGESQGHDGEGHEHGGGAAG